jgi:glycine oxidase
VTSPDVIVIGAGIIGCAVAHEMTGRGARVHVIDGRDVGQGATQASAGVLAPYIEGHEGTALQALGARSLGLFDGFVSRAAAESGLDVPYERCGTLEVAVDQESARELRARAARAATGKARLVTGAELRELEPQLAADVAVGLIQPEHGYVAAGALTLALARAAAAAGAVFTVSEAVVTVARRDDVLEVATPDGRLSGPAVVLAAGSWSSRVKVEDAAPPPVRPVRGQLLHLKWPDARGFQHVIWGPRCYLVSWPDGSVLVGATVEDVGFDETATVTGVHDLLEAASDLAPRAWAATFAGVRVGLRPGTPDGLPMVGPSSRVPGLVYATGHYRNGILLAPLTARLVADFVLDHRADPALASLAPARLGEY